MFDTNLYREGKYVKAGWPHDDSFGGRAKFLTYWTMVLLFFFHGEKKINTLKYNEKKSFLLKGNVDILFHIQRSAELDSIHRLNKLDL
jgi:hypothetical protein